MTIYHTRRSLTIALAALGMTPLVSRAQGHDHEGPPPGPPRPDPVQPPDPFCIGEGFVSRGDYEPCCVPLTRGTDGVCRLVQPTTTTTAPPVVTTTTAPPVKKKRKHRRRRR